MTQILCLSGDGIQQSTVQVLKTVHLPESERINYHRKVPWIDRLGTIWDHWVSLSQGCHTGPHVRHPCGRTVNSPSDHTYGLVLNLVPGIVGGTKLDRTCDTRPVVR